MQLMSEENKLKIAEHFYSLQGEGMSSGTPAVFLRLSGCQFDCSWCDTVEVWRHGTWYQLDEVDGLFDINSYYRRLRMGAHLVITGGDPLIQQMQLSALFNRLLEFGREPHRIYVEVETQGYNMPRPEFSKWVKQWNVSPKLANSGVEEDKRIISDVLNWHANSNSCFKFPISNEDEFREVDRIVRQHQLKRTRVYLMPVSFSREDLIDKSKMVAEMAMRTGYRYSSRLQLLIWDKTTGV